MNKKLLLFRVLFIMCVIMLFIIHRLNFYYIILDENNSYKYDDLLSICEYIDIYNADIEVFKYEAEIDEIPEYGKKRIPYNNTFKDELIINPMKAVRIAKGCFLYIDYGTKEFLEPCFVTYNSNANVWIVQENIYKSKFLVGGEFVAVIDADTGNVIYATCFQ